MRESWQKFLCLLPIACASAIGCDDGRQPLSGTVTLDGKPLTWGAIAFHSKDRTSRTSSGGTVTDGKFAIPKHQGLVPGAYDVVIEPVIETGQYVNDHQDGRMIGRETVLFREAGKLEATITESGENLLNFELTRTR